MKTKRGNGRKFAASFCCCFVDNSIELILLLATYVAHNAPLPLGLARWGSQGETLLLAFFCRKCTPSKTSVVGRELEPTTLPSAPRNIFFESVTLLTVHRSLLRI